MKMLFWELFCSSALCLVITPAGADESSGKLTIGVFEEYYPDSNALFDSGNIPRSLGLLSSYGYVKNPSDSGFFNPEISFNTELKWERDPERYDSDRSSLSISSSLNLSTPVLIPSDKSIKWIGGADFDLNGPQNNDMHWVLHSGLQLYKDLYLYQHPLSFQVSLEYAKYFYKVDDEPAAEQTNTVRERLDHEGEGFLWALSANYQRPPHQLSFEISRLKAGDDQEPGGYRKNLSTIRYRYRLGQTSTCGVNFSVIKHNYGPRVLLYSDELYQSKFVCTYLF